MHFARFRGCIGSRLQPTPLPHARATTPRATTTRYHHAPPLRIASRGRGRIPANVFDTPDRQRAADGGASISHHTLPPFLAGPHSPCRTIAVAISFALLLPRIAPSPHGQCRCDASPAASPARHRPSWRLRFPPPCTPHLCRRPALVGAAGWPRCGDGGSHAAATAAAAAADGAGSVWVRRCGWPR